MRPRPGTDRRSSAHKLTLTLGTYVVQVESMLHALAHPRLHATLPERLLVIMASPATLRLALRCAKERLRRNGTLCEGEEHVYSAWPTRRCITLSRGDGPRAATPTRGVTIVAWLRLIQVATTAPEKGGPVKSVGPKGTKDDRRRSRSSSAHRQLW